MYFLTVLRRQTLPLILIPVACIFLGVIYLVYADPKYSASAMIGLNAGDGRQPDDLDAILASHVATIGADQITAEVIERLSLGSGTVLERGDAARLVAGLRQRLGLGGVQPLTDEERKTLLIDRVKASLEVERVDETTLIKVRYTADSPQKAALIANEYADVFVDQVTDRSAELSRQTELFVRSRAADLRSLVESSYQTAQQIKSSTGDDVVGFQDLEARIAQLTVTLSDIDETRAGITEKILLLQDTGDLASLEAAALQAEGGTEVFMAYSDAYRRLSQFKAMASPPGSVAQLESTVEALRRELDQVLKRTLLGLEQELKVISGRRESVAGNLSSALRLISSRDWSQIRSAEYEATVFENIYADYLRELENAKRAAIAAPVSIITPARPDPTPSWPDYKVLLILAAFGGVTLGALAAMAREWNRPEDQPAEPEPIQHDGFSNAFEVLRQRRLDIETREAKYGWE